MKRQVVSTPAELVATVPYVIGYQPPSGAVAMVALGEGRVVVTACETKFADAGENLVGGPYGSTCSLAVVADTFGARIGAQASTVSDTQASCNIKRHTR